MRKKDLDRLLETAREEAARPYLDKTTKLTLNECVSTLVILNNDLEDALEREYVACEELEEVEAAYEELKRATND